jgi:hypothetical protein
VASVLVDSNVLLDVLTGDRDWDAWSSKALEDVAERSTLVINPLICSEISIGLHRIPDIECQVRRE